jgi:hypothetical protein
MCTFLHDIKHNKGKNKHELVVTLLELNKRMLPDRMKLTREPQGLPQKIFTENKRKR